MPIMVRADACAVDDFEAALQRAQRFHHADAEIPREGRTRVDTSAPRPLGETAAAEQDHRRTFIVDPAGTRPTGVWNCSARQRGIAEGCRRGGNEPWHCGARPDASVNAPGLAASRAERQRLMGKPMLDVLAARYAM
jgi:hypothetical protein